MRKKLEIKFLKATGQKGFSVLAGINRPVYPSHVTKMAESIEKMGIIRPIVVSTISFLTGSPIQYIIDGQHLYNACIRLGDDIPYTEIEVKNEQDLAEKLALLNNSSKSWSMKDYLTVWSNIRADYKKLNHYMNVYDIELSQVAEIFSNGYCSNSIGGNGQVSKMIKRGDFKIKDEQKGLFILECITDALKIVPRMDRSSNKLFIASYVNFINAYPNYIHKNYMQKLQANKDKFKLVTLDPEEYQKLLKSIL
jgi:hypothetical protein